MGTNPSTALRVHQGGGSVSRSHAYLFHTLKKYHQDGTRTHIHPPLKRYSATELPKSVMSWNGIRTHVHRYVSLGQLSYLII